MQNRSMIKTAFLGFLCVSGIFLQIHALQQMDTILHDGFYIKGTLPKVWFKYISAMLFKGIRRLTQISSLRNISYIERTILEISRRFTQTTIVSYIKRVILEIRLYWQLAKEPKFILIHYDKKGVKESLLDKLTFGDVICVSNCVSLVVTKPLGTIEKNVSRDKFGRPVVGRSANQNNIFYFKLDGHLRLELKFPFIIMMFRGIHTCDVGKIKIESEGQNFIFCGVQTNVQNYPPGKAANVSLRFAKTAETYFKMLYSVIDKSNLLSKVVPHKLKQKLNDLIYLVQKDSLLLKFVFTTSKLRHLMLNSFFSPNIIHVHKGLSSEATSIIKSKHGLYVIDYFQSTVYLLLKSHKKYSHMVNKVYYLTNLIKIDKELNMKRNTLYLTFHSIMSDYILIKLWTDKNNFLNATITNILYEGPYDPTCIHSGVTFYNSFNKSQSEISTECYYGHSLYNYQNIYSKSNEMFLVFYSQRDHANLNVTLSMSATTCKPIYIDPCVMNYLCRK